MRLDEKTKHEKYTQELLTMSEHEARITKRARNFEDETRQRLMTISRLVRASEAHRGDHFEMLDAVQEKISDIISRSRLAEAECTPHYFLHTRGVIARP